MHNLLAMALSKLGWHRSAIRELGKALHIDGRYRLAQANLRMERLLLAGKIDSAARDQLLAALELPEERNAERLAAAKKVLASCPAFSEARFLLANCLMERGELAQAKTELARVCKEDPANVGASFNLGLLLHDAGAMKEAAAAFRRVLAVDRHHGQGNFRLGIIEFQLGNETTAIRHLNYARQRLPLDANAAFWAGYANARAGNMDEARKALERAVALNPEHADARVHLALLLHSMGLSDDACSQARKARDLGIPLPSELTLLLRRR